MLPSPRTLAALTSLLRECLLGPLIGRRGTDGTDAGASAATVVAPSPVPFAPTSYARARLLRQLHASGLLLQPVTRLSESADLLETAG